MSNITTYVAALERLHACAEALDWLATQPDIATAWRVCERGDWMAWLEATLVCHTPWGSPERRRFADASAEVLISLARPCSDEHTDAAIDAMIALLERYALGEPVTREEFAARAARAAGAAWAAGAASLRSSAEIVRAHYPQAPALP